jgi:peroxin-1
VKCDWFDDEDEEMLDDGLRVWVDRDLLHTKSLKGVNWVSISIVKPTGIQEKIDPQKDAVESEKPTTKLVARIGVWEDAPDDQHAALSTMLCNCLSSSGLVGGLVRIEPAPARLDPATVQSKSKDTTHRFGLKIYPFLSSPSSQTSGLKFGGESKQEREESVHRLRAVFAAFARKSGGNGLLNGPLTDGMLLPVVKDQGKDWNGGILRFEPATSSPEGSQAPVSWILPADKSLPMEFLPEIARPSNAMKSWSPGESLLSNPPSLVGIDSMVNQLISHLAHSSSVLLSGRLGCGKSIVAQLIAHRLRSEYLFHTVYFPCRSRITGETRVSVVKDTLGRLFAAASWGARLGGRAVVILDDLDSLCPAETELGEGGDNVRSRHISESLCAVVRQHCTQESGVVLLATSQSKEALNNVIIGSHVVREIMNLSSPNKDMRRRVLEALFEEHKPEVNGVSDKSPLPSIKRSPATKSVESRPSTSDGPPGFDISPNVDFLDLAGQTDGYMPGDLVLLASRARSECLIRSVVDAMSSSPSSRLTLSTADFDAALKGFTPASLRNVTLQTSTVRWSSIGGLESTRKVLLETLQYPTTYAPIFSRCPLRLRSGIMLYGYPGCGKTLLASAIASECGLNFISVKGPEILNKYIGASEKSVRDLFERAQAARPCVLFFDEFDSIAPKRGHDSTGVTDRVVNQLLTQMDGAEGLGEGVYVLAATSRPDLVDPALLRPGRLDKSIICDMPNLEDRTNILGAVAANLKIDENVKARWSEVAKKTEGFSGADLQALVYNAQLEAVHDVLGDGSAKDGIGNSKFGAQRNGSSKFKRTPDFEMFRLDDSADTDSRDHSSTFLAERAVIAAKLRDMQAAKRSQKAALKAQAQQQLRHRASQQDADSGDDMWDHSPPPLSRKAGGDDSRAAVGVEGDHKRDKEPTILWRHIQSSLSLTRSSISPEERRRLERIYREFVVGRSGDLPSGQGSTEIGGRTSLM